MKKNFFLLSLFAGFMVIACKPDAQQEMLKREIAVWERSYERLKSEVYSLSVELNDSQWSYLQTEALAACADEQLVLAQVYKTNTADLIRTSVKMHIKAAYALDSVCFNAEQKNFCSKYIEMQKAFAHKLYLEAYLLALQKSGQ